jgi:hypothetical protein
LEWHDVRFGSLAAPFGYFSLMSALERIADPQDTRSDFHYKL